MTYQFRNATILVVDDMKPMLSLVASILKIFGFNSVHTASDAEEAFNLFCQVKPDLVLTDWLMEPFDGIELVRRFRTHPKSPNRFVPVVMMTGYSHRIRVEKARDVGVTEFLVKPFSSRDLYLRIEQLIEKPRKFVDTGEFFGPDRRRRKGFVYTGEGRRESDEEPIYGDMPPGEDAEAVLKNLREQIKKTGVPGKYDDK